jgi:ankyrin repeat protein
MRWTNLGAPPFGDDRLEKILACGLVLVLALLLWRGDFIWDQLAGNPRGIELLFCSSGSGDLDGIERALEQGADINARDAANLTPLMIACDSQANSSTVRLLLDRGADPTLEADTGITALYNAVNGDNADLVEVLLSAGVNPDHALNGETVLDLAIRLDRQRVVKVLRAHRGRTSHNLGSLVAADLSPSL